MNEQQENRDGVDLDELEELEEDEDTDDNMEAPVSWSEMDRIARQLHKIIYHL